MEKDTLLELIFRSSTNRQLREEQLLNIFGVTSLDDIPTKDLIEFCNNHYCTKEKLVWFLLHLMKLEQSISLKCFRRGKQLLSFLEKMRLSRLPQAHDSLMNKRRRYENQRLYRMC